MVSIFAGNTILGCLAFPFSALWHHLVFWLLLRSRLVCLIVVSLKVALPVLSSLFFGVALWCVWVWTFFFLSCCLGFFRYPETQADVFHRLWEILIAILSYFLLLIHSLIPSAPLIGHTTDPFTLSSLAFNVSYAFSNFLSLWAESQINFKDSFIIRLLVMSNLLLKLSTGF